MFVRHLKGVITSRRIEIKGSNIVYVIYW